MPYRRIHRLSYRHHVFVWAEGCAVPSAGCLLALVPVHGCVRAEKHRPSSLPLLPSMKERDFRERRGVREREAEGKKREEGGGERVGERPPAHPFPHPLAPHESHDVHTKMKTRKRKQNTDELSPHDCGGQRTRQQENNSKHVKVRTGREGSPDVERIPLPTHSSTDPYPGIDSPTPFFILFDELHKLCLQ